jgi:hypothetical protein
MKTCSSIAAKILIVMLVPILISCNTFGVKQIKKEPNDSVFTAASFQKVSIEGKGRFRIYIKQSGQDGYKIEAAPEQLESVKVLNENNCLKITGKKKLDNDRREINIYIHIKTIQEIKSSSVSDIQFENTITGESLSIETSGVNNVTGTLIIKKLDVNDSGVNKFNLNGKVERLNLNKSGIGSFNALDLEVQEGIINVSGIGSARVNILKSAEFYSSGIAKISYKGNPVIKKSDQSGLAIIRKL